MLNMSLRIAARALTQLRGIIVALALLLAFSAAGLLLALRYWVLPDVETYHAEIVAAVSRTVGQEVEIGKIEADWRGLGPHLRLTDIRILDKQKRTSLALQRVDVVVSWMTLAAAELRLASLEIDQPDLMIKRDVRGVIQVSGVKMEGEAGDNNFANMLLHQARIVVRGAHISWQDEKQDQPLLAFEDVNLLIENGWNHHRFALQASPPSELSTRLDVRGDLFGENFDDLSGWRGEVFTQIDYVDLAAWKTWLPLPVRIAKGKGALRGWLSLYEGKISQLTADLALVNVRTRLADDLQALDIRVLSGRLGWRNIEHGFELSLNNFSFKLFDDFVLKPTDLFVSLHSVPQAETSAGELRANLLELEGLGKLMAYLPLEDKLKKQFVEFSPHGRVEDLRALWQRNNAQEFSYKIKAKFSELSLQRVGKIPGFSGLSGEVEGSDSRGTLIMNSHNLMVDAPQFMPEALTVETLSAQTSWLSDQKSLTLKLHSLSASNEDATGTAYGSYQTVTGSHGKLDLNVHLTNATVLHAGKYIPLVALGGSTREWINKALLGGRSNDFNLRIKGDLNDFPFVGNRRGIFKINARLNGAELEYDPHWPRIHNGIAELLIQGKQLSVTASSAMSNGVQLQNVRVEIPDVLSKDVILNVNGEAKGEHTKMLGFIHNSPVRGYLDGLTDDVTASGNGKLNLQLDIPLHELKKVKVAGGYHFSDSEVSLNKNLPTLRKVNGDLQFTEAGASTKNIGANIFGGPAKLVIENREAGKQNIKLTGRANLTALRLSNPHPLLRKLSGNPEWGVEVDVQHKLSKVIVTSSLLGLQSELPAPLSKQAEEAIPLRVEMNMLSAEERTFALHYGTLLNAEILQQKDEDGTWGTERGIVNFGNVEYNADRDGLWIIGTLPHVSLAGWGVLADAVESDPDRAPMAIAGADFSIQKINGYGHLVHDLHIKASSRRDTLTAQLAAKEVNGEVSWQDRGRLFVRLKNLDLGLDYGDANKKSEQDLDTTSTQKVANNVELPAIDLAIDRLSNKGKLLGKLELQAHQDDQTYQLNRLRLSSPDGVLNVDGKWNTSSEAAETELNLRLDISNAGNFLTRVGHPNAIKNGSGTLEGTFTWLGTPWMVSKSGLNGKLSVDTGKGQFLQIDQPGMGKLVSILNLQALPKRLVLDFDDVFSKGFEFDSIKGLADIKEGVMRIDKLKIDGSAAKVTMKGQINLANETLDLKVRIVPALGNTAALISALVATPVVVAGVVVAAPVVVAGVFFGSKILEDPLGQLAAFEYNISGNWVDPKMEKVGEKRN